MQSLAEQLRSKQDSGTLMQYQKHPNGFSFIIQNYARIRIAHSNNPAVHHREFWISCTGQNMDVFDIGQNKILHKTTILF